MAQSSIVIVDAATTGHIVEIVDADALTTGSIMRLKSNSSSTGTRNLMSIHNDHANATGTTPLYVQNDSTGPLATFLGSGGVGIGLSPTMGKLNIETTGTFTTAFTDANGTGISMYSTDTAGTDKYGPAITWGALGGVNSHQAALTSVQTGSDANQVGLAMFVHNSTTGSAAMTEAARISHGGTLSVASTITTAAAGSYLATGAGRVHFVSPTGENCIWGTNTSNSDTDLQIKGYKVKLVDHNNNTNYIINNARQHTWYDNYSNTMSFNADSNGQFYIKQGVHNHSGLKLAVVVGAVGRYNQIEWTNTDGGGDEPLTYIRTTGTGSYGSALSFWTRDGDGNAATNPLERLTIDNDGNVGIGTTSNTIGGMLETYNGTDNTRHWRIHRPGTAEFGIGIQGDMLSISANAIPAPSDNGIFMKFNTGLVGIGATDPTTKLQVAHPDGGIISVRRNDTSIANNDLIGELQFLGDDPTVGVVGAAIKSFAEGGWYTNYNAANIEFWTDVGNSYANRFRITAAGYIELITLPPTTTTNADLPILIRDSAAGKISRDSSLTWNPATDNMFIGGTDGTYVGSNYIRSGGSSDLQLGTAAHGVSAKIKSNGKVELCDNFSSQASFSSYSPLHVSMSAGGWLAAFDRMGTTASARYGLLLRTGQSGGTTGMINIESNHPDCGGAGTDTEFILRVDGQAYADQSWNASGADYAEYFESTDNSAIPVGTTVVMVDNKVRASTGSDATSTIIGVVRPKKGGASIVGNSPVNWQGKHLKDSFGQKIQNADESYQLNPAFDPDLEYVVRDARDEWQVIGLLGQIAIKKGQTIGDRWIKLRDIDATVELWLVR